MGDEPKAVKMHIDVQGCVRVNHAFMHAEADGIACIYIDLHSKRATEPMLTCGPEHVPTLWFGADENTLHLDPTKTRDSMTVVQFPEYLGWDIFACDGPRRYTVALTLVKKHG